MNSFNDISIISVSELTHSIKSSLELQYRFIHIRGEISNLRTPYSGHTYFTLKDNSSQIRAVLFKGQQKYLSIRLEEGLKVICHGRLSVYEARGEYQIIVDTVDSAGAGELQLQFELLKKKLADQGFFLSEIKKKIPAFPEHIVLITSPTGAAVQDFLKISSNRNFGGTITILPVPVQGKNAAAEIAEAIEIGAAMKNVDCLVLLRGGGSLEDLWSFNEEKVALAIHRSIPPVVTGIGHETDLTIADLCADLHSHTPTAAAEAIIPDTNTLRSIVEKYTNQLQGTMTHLLKNKSEKISNLRRIMGNLELYLANYTLQLDYQISSLTQHTTQFLSSLQRNVEMRTNKLHSEAPLNKLQMHEQKLLYLQWSIYNNSRRIIERKEDRLAKQAALLDSVSPLSVLARGYSIVSKNETIEHKKKIITNAVQVQKGDKVDIQLYHGTLECAVLRRRLDGHSSDKKDE
ncbi:MAG: exodeoxyribonuclease VII large subunit [Desulfopila sp.]|nr:exodeoxyribonuclease VII large subunit [Desulfopila sp.]